MLELDITGRNRYAAYVGVTGFMARNELPDLLDKIREQDDGDLRASGQLLFGIEYADHQCPFYQLQAGFLVNWDSVNGLQPKKPYRYPHPDYLHEMLSEANWMNANPVEIPWFPVIHFNVADESQLVYGMQKVEDITDCCPLNFQINFRWPSAFDLTYFAKYATKERRRIILQIGSGALGEIGMDADKLVEALKPYGHSITDILVDPSGGHGKSSDFESLRPLIAAVYEQLPYLGVGVAGGLCAENMSQLAGLFRDFPWLSIDAENNLRYPIDAPQTNVIDIEASARYVGEAVKILRQAVE